MVSGLWVRLCDFGGVACGGGVFGFGVCFRVVFGVWCVGLALGMDFGGVECGGGVSCGFRFYVGLV